MMNNQRVRTDWLPQVQRKILDFCCGKKDMLKAPDEIFMDTRKTLGHSVKFNSSYYEYNYF